MYKKIYVFNVLVTVYTLGFEQQKIEFADAPKNLKINQLQVLGTHNSYAMPVDSNLLNYNDVLLSKAKAGLNANMSKEQLAEFNEFHPNKLPFKEFLKYNHPDFQTQLNAGLRNLEIDVYYDSTGNRFNHPASYPFLTAKGYKNLAPYSVEDLDKPGFKVLHIADLDFRTHYPTLKLALLALKKWSKANPKHVPIFIQIEAKESEMKIFPNSTQVLKYDERAFDELDKELVDVLGKDNIITPDEIRGNYKTLKEAVLANNWPTLDDARGKFIFLLLPTTAGIGAESSPYTTNHPNLENRIMFVQSKPEQDNAAFLLLDNAIVRQEDIKKYVKQGYMVRTRSDIDTYEAKVNDYTRAKAAFNSGAQVISTDFFMSGKNTYGNNYRVRLPGGGVARVNPINGIIKK